ncbi:MAG: SBBP repeat-containing protein [Chloroflexota bacterium]
MTTMNYRRWFSLFLTLLLMILTGVSVKAAQPSARSFSERSTALFIENVGQFHEDLRFVTLGGDRTFALFDDSIWISLATPNLRTAHVKLSFENANPTPQLVPFEVGDAEGAFFRGKDASNWYRDVPTWRGVRYVELYPNIDLEFYENLGQISYRLVVHEGGDLRDVVMQIDNVERISVAGDQIELSILLEKYYHFDAERFTYAIPLLDLHTDKGTLTVQNIAPIVDGVRIVSPVAVIEDDLNAGDSNSTEDSQLAQAEHIPHFTRLFGGISQDFGDSVVVDRTGDVYVYGSFLAGDFLPSRFTTTQDFSSELDTGIISQMLRNHLISYGYEIETDAYIADKKAGAWWKIEDQEHVVWVEKIGSTTFISPSRLTAGYGTIAAKLDGRTGNLMYASFLTGISSSSFTKVSVDNNGYLYITGKGGVSLPTTPDAYDTTFYQGGDAFALKLDKDGQDIVYGTYLGNGENDDKGQAIAVDADGNAYITGGGGNGYTNTPGSYSYGSGTFIIKLNSDGSDIVYHATVGGGWARDIAVDPLGNVYIAGLASKSNIPTTAQAYDRNGLSPQSDGKAYVLKLSSDGSTLLYGTYLGGTSSLGDGAFAISVDDEGNAYVAGDTASSDFPITSGAYDNTLSGVTGYITKLSLDGSHLIYSTLIGSSNVRDLAIDSAGNAYVVGMTQSELYPTTEDGIDRTFNGNMDTFVTVINSDGSDLLYSTYLGSGKQSNFFDDGRELGYGIDVGPCGHIFATGYTGSFEFTATDVLNSKMGGNSDIFVTKLSPKGVEDDCTGQANLGANSDSLNEQTRISDETDTILKDANILANMYREGLDGGTNITVIYRETFVQDNQTKLFIITQITPPGDFTCRLCYPEVGAAVFAKLGNSWQLEAAAPNMGQFGMWGTIYKGELVEIGRERYGMLFETYFGGGAMSFLTSGRALMYPADGTISFVFNELTAESTGPFCEQGEISCYDWSAEFEIVPNSSRRFHDIVMKSQGTRPVAESDEIESFEEDVVYRFNGIEYALDERQGNVSRPTDDISLSELLQDGDFSEIVKLLSDASRQKNRELLDQLLSNNRIWAAPYATGLGDIDEAATAKAKRVLVNALLQNEVGCAGYRTEPGTENWVWGRILVNRLTIDWKKEFGWGNAANPEEYTILNFGIRDDGWRFHGYSPVAEHFIQSRFSDLAPCPVLASDSDSNLLVESQIISVTPTAEPRPTSTPQPPQLVVLVSALNVREGPGTSYTPVGQVTNGELLEVLGRNQDGSWWNVCCVDGKSGWVINNTAYVRLQFSSAASQVQSVATPTLPALGRNCASSADFIFAPLWQQHRSLIGCPTSGRFVIPTIAEELFQGGHMFWRSDRDEIYAIYDRNKANGANLVSGRWQTNAAWKWDGSAPDGIGLSPPSGMVEPKRGFGFVWRNYLNRESGPLGWALDREYGFDRVGQIQLFEKGLMFRGSDPKVYLLLYDGRFFAR